MTDIEQLKATIDLRLLVEEELGRPVSRGSAAWTFKCPFHQEIKGASLAVYKDGWKCWGACQEGGDVLTWVAKRNNLDLHHAGDFREVVRLLGGRLDGSYKPPRTLSQGAKPAEAPTPAEPPSLEWQAAAQEIVEYSQRMLWSPPGRPGLEYLVHKRGLWTQTVEEAQLGYIPEGPHRSIEMHGLVVPSHSITIPWFADGALWGIKCRRLAGDDPRYKEVSAAKGQEERLGKSNLHGGLYWVDNIAPHQPVMVVEGEFNCLSLWEAAKHLVRPVSLGPSGASLNVRWFAQLVTASVILIWFDHDEAGRKGADRLAGLAGGVQEVELPEGVGKDVNDFWVMARRRGDLRPVASWIEALLPR